MRFVNKLVLYFSVLCVFGPVYGVYLGIEDDDDFADEVTTEENLTRVAALIRGFSYPSNVGAFFDVAEQRIKEINLQKMGKILQPGDRTEELLLEKAVEFYLKGDAEILWIPNILWDLYLLDRVAFGNIRFPLSDKRFVPISNSFLLWFFRNGCDQKLRKKDPKKFFTGMIKKLFKKLTRHYERSQGVPVNKEDEELVALGIELAEQESSGTELNDDYAAIIKLLVLEEAQLFDNKRSILNRVLSAQIQARKKNRALLFRHTTGTNFQVDFGEGTKNYVALDFPLNKTAEGGGPGKAISEIDSEVARRNLATTPIDFRYSIFGGAADKLDTCIYVAHKKLKKKNKPSALYFLSLDKTWLLTKGRHMFYLPVRDARGMIFGEKQYPVMKIATQESIKKYNSRKSNPTKAQFFVDLDKYDPVGYDKKVPFVGEQKTKKLFSYIVHASSIFYSRSVIIDHINLLNFGNKIKEFYTGQNSLLDMFLGDIKAGVPLRTKGRGIRIMGKKNYRFMGESRKLEQNMPSLGE